MSFGNKRWTRGISKKAESRNELTFVRIDGLFWPILDFIVMIEFQVTFEVLIVSESFSPLRTSIMPISVAASVSGSAD